MGKKKPSKYKPGKYQFIVSSDKPIVRIEDLDPTNYPVKVIKPPLNSKGGVMKEVEGKRLGGDVSCKGGGAAIRGTDFKGVF